MQTLRPHLLRLLVPLIIIAVVGCSRGPGTIKPPNLDPDDAAAAAITAYDTDASGSLSKQELAASPPLLAVLDQYDTSADGALSPEEIAEGIRLWQEGAVGVRALPFKVTFAGRPFVGASVRLVPAPFLGDAVKPATGEAGPTGGGNLRIAPQDLPPNTPNMPLVQPGLYSVEITHPTISVPPMYNTETTLGIEITSGNPGQAGVTWSLTN